MNLDGTQATYFFYAYPNTLPALKDITASGMPAMGAFEEVTTSMPNFSNTMKNMRVYINRDPWTERGFMLNFIA